MIESNNQQNQSLLEPQQPLQEDQVIEIPNENSCGCFPLRSKGILETSLLLFKSGVPTGIAYVCSFLIGLICLRYIGKYGTPENLAGASLGYTWANVFCLGFFYSIDQGCCVLVSRLFGERNYRAMGLLFQKNLCVLTVIAIPLLCSLIFADKVLIAIGLDYETSISAGIYLKTSIPSLIGMSLFNTQRFFLMAQNVFFIPGLILLILMPVNILWCELFVVKLGMPLEGACFAKAITDLTSAIILFIYMRSTKEGKNSLIPFSRECLKGWGKHLKETFMIGGTLYIEWINFEISMFIIGAMNNPYALGAHGIALNLALALYTIPLGNNLSMQTFIGNAIGEGDNLKVKKFMTVGLMNNFIASGVNVLLMIIGGKQISLFFTSDEQTQEALQKILFVYGLGHFQDTYSNHLAGILRVLGKEKEVIINYVFSGSIVTLILQWVLGIVLKYGYVGVWIGSDIGMTLLFILMLIKLVRLDWKKEAAKIKESMEQAAANLTKEENIEHGL